MTSTDPEKPMSGKVCLVTGATAGIGEVTARELARLGAAVVVVGRSRPKCEETVRQIQQQTGSSAVDFLVADLSSQAEVRSLAAEFRQKYGRLDVLINNAGAFFDQRRETPDGIEMTLALNHLAYFLLTSLLLDVIKASAPARIINVSSEGHRGAVINFDDLQGQQKYGGFRAYCQSKLANLLFTFALAARLEGTRVTVNALHPGFVASNFFAGRGLLRWLVRRIASLAALSPEDGASTTIYLATSPDVAGVTGEYFEKQRPRPSSPESHNQAAGARLWEVSEKLTGLVTDP
jgi:NAD(P)-dependent dehydrogenase (short-subunit alcohol dehydrogenase family)